MVQCVVTTLKVPQITFNIEDSRYVTSRLCISRHFAISIRSRAAFGKLSSRRVNAGTWPTWADLTILLSILLRKRNQGRRHNSDLINRSRLLPLRCTNGKLVRQISTGAHWAQVRLKKVGSSRRSALSRPRPTRISFVTMDVIAKCK